VDGAKPINFNILKSDGGGKAGHIDLGGEGEAGCRGQMEDRGIRFGQGGHISAADFKEADWSGEKKQLGREILVRAGRKWER